MEYVKEVKLAVPIKTKNHLVEVIKFRKPKARDVKHMLLKEEQDMDFILKIGASISDLPANALIYELDLEDTFKVVEIVSGFLGSGPQST